MGFLDNLFPNRKEKTPKSDKSKNPAPNVNRTRPRPPPHSDQRQEEPPSTTTTLFGSLRRLKVGVATSTPKKEENNNKAEENKNKSKIVKRKGVESEATHTATIRGVASEVDSIARTPTTSQRVVNSQVVLRRRGKENVGFNGEKVDQKKRPLSKEVIAVSRTQEGLRKEKIKSSTPSLNNVFRVQSKSTQSQQPKPKRPVTLAIPNNVYVRGHKEGQGHPDNISRTSSVTNLDSLEANLQGQQGGQQGKGAKPRKAASKERIDKQAQDGKKVTKNNNKLEPPIQPTVPPLSYSSDSLQEAELQHLRKQLREMSDEKSSLALQLGEQRGQLNVLQKEIQKLKSFQDESSLEMDKLAEENTALRNRLRDVAHSPLSDNEKQQLLFESRHHSSAPASIATNVVEDNGGDATTCTTPDWDKHSSGNVSEVSVACLQDKINQMQETHYSTNEELQATLQELTDLQRQLTELQQENERLNEEKTLMFDSLCRQTERLNDSRQEVENLKQLLYRDRSDETGANQLESAVEREQKLVELLRSAQEEREQLLLKLDQIQAELHESRGENIQKSEANTQQSERIKTLECTLDAKHAEHKQLDQELAQAKDQCSGKQIEINRLTDLLENARTKINELEQDRTLSDKSELDELLDNARKEKDQLESEVAYLKEQLARSKNEIEKLKEQVFVLQEECKVTRNNAKTTQSDLEYKCEKLVTEKNTLGEQLQQFQEAVNELQVQAQCHLEDKRQLSAVLSETQRNLSEAESKNLNLETEIQELKKLRQEENDEWEKFQNDLLTSVRVANDFKTEAQQELQKIILENKTYRERLRLLEGQVEKFKGEKTTTSTQTDIILTPQIITLARNVDPSITNRISLLEHPISPTPTGSPTSPTSNMEKLFPILSRERKSKSRESLADDLHKKSEAAIKRSKSRDNLSNTDASKKSSLTFKNEKTKDIVGPIELPKKESKSFLKRNKSKENLAEHTVQGFALAENPSKGSGGFLKRNKSKENLAEPTVESISPVENSSKGSKGFLKRNKSKDKLDQLAADVDGGKSVNDSSKKELGAVDKPRKSKDSIESSSSGSKSDAKPEFFSKFIKKREKPIRSNRKNMSVEEETLLKSLDNWYEHIDQNVPDEYLSKEDRAVKKLKILFEDDLLKERPVAHKPKEQLAISKPLLNSVVRNPKLEEIVRDPRVPTVETQVRESALEDTCTLINEATVDRPRYRLKSEEVYTNIGPPFLGIHKTQSLDDLHVFEEYRTESELAPVLHKAVEARDLTMEASLEMKNVSTQERTPSEIYPNDSVSNPRYSTKDSEAQLKEYAPNDLPKPNIYINFENLDEIIGKIPKDCRESKLNEEHKFALKLKLALDEAEEQNALKKINKKKKSIKGLEISGPTQESVERNWKLKEIMLNPNIKKAEEAKSDKFFQDLFEDCEWKRHSTDISSDIGELNEVSRRSGIINANSMISKSYEDISFSFVPENTLLNLYYGSKDQTRGRPKIVSDTSSSSQSFTSAEFNLDTGKIIQKCDIPTAHETPRQKETVQDEKLGNNDKEDLLYNETINKDKNKKTKPVKDDLEYNETLEKLKRDLSANKTKIVSELRLDEEDQDPRILGSLERYKKDLKQMVKTIEADELRQSLRKTGYKPSHHGVYYQEVQTGRVPDENKEDIQNLEEVFNEGQRETIDIDQNNKEQSLNVREGDNGKIEEISDQKIDNKEQDMEVRSKEHIVKNEDNNEPKDVNYLQIKIDGIVKFIANERKFSRILEDDQRDLHTRKEVPEPTVTYNSHANSPGPDTINQFKTASSQNRSFRLDETLRSLKNKEFSEEVDFTQEQSNIEFTDKRGSYQIVTPVINDHPEEHLTLQEHTKESDANYKPEKTGPRDEEHITFQFPTKLQDSKLFFQEEIDKNVYLTTPCEEKDACATKDPGLIRRISFENPKPREEHIDIASQLSTDNFKNQFSPRSGEPSEFKNSMMEGKEISEKDLNHGPNQCSPDTALGNDIISCLEPAAITENKPNEINIFSTIEVDVAAPQTATVNEEYGYKEILKENQYGVVSPLDLRYTYRGVVKEYKKKFPSEDIEETEEVNIDDDDGSNLEYNDSFIDEFFNPPKGFEHDLKPKIEEIDSHEEEAAVIDESPKIETQSTIFSDVGVDIRDAVSQIDKEMQDIMKTYLHTRSSLIVKKTGVDREVEDKSLEPKSNLKKYDNFENLHEIDNSGSKDNDGGKRLTEKIGSTEIFRNEDVTAVELDCLQNADDDEPLSLEDLKFIEEMKAKYASADTASTISEKSFGQPILRDERIENEYQHLTDEELDLLRSASRDRYFRPLSDFNEKDLLLVDEISKRYLKDNSLSSSVRSSLQEERESLPNKSENEDDMEIIEKNQSVPALPANLSPKISTEYTVKHEEIKEGDHVAEGAILPTSSVPKQEMQEELQAVKLETSKAEDKVQAFERRLEFSLARRREKENFKLPPSLIPKKPAGLNKHQPLVPLQPRGHVMLRDKRASNTQGQSNRLSTSSTTDRTSNRLSDLIFKETIFVPVSRDDKNSNIPRSPLSPKYKHLESRHEETRTNYEKPDSRETIVVPRPRRFGPVAVSKNVIGPSSNLSANPSFRETIFISTPDEAKKLITSTTTSVESQYVSGNSSWRKSTIIVPATSALSMDTHTSSKNEPSQISISNENKPSYHSFTETIVVPTKHESHNVEEGNSELLRLKQSSTRSEVKVNFNRYSAIPQPIVSTKSIRSNQKRSLSEPFKPRSLDDGLATYEPVYSNVNFTSRAYREVFNSNIKKKPLPVPRSTESVPYSASNQHLAGTNPKTDYVKSENDSSGNMTDSNENFSEIVPDKTEAKLNIPNASDLVKIQATFASGTSLKVDKDKGLVLSEHNLEEKLIPTGIVEHVPSEQVILVEESKAETDILKNKENSLTRIREFQTSENSALGHAVTALVSGRSMSAPTPKDEQSVTSDSSSTVRSAGSIAITTKSEQLDISKVKTSTDCVLEEDVENVERQHSTVDQSNVNLFTMDSHCSYDSYLELFRTKESKDFDDLRGKKSPVKNFVGMQGFVYVQEVSSEDLSADNEVDASGSEVKPKVVDFVPLDDKTTPFFTKDDGGSYDTLEREKTFHVLGQASKISNNQSKDNVILPKVETKDPDVAPEQDPKGETDKNNLETSLEILARKSSSFSKASSKSQTNTSRTSFSQAKKLFEALVEANKDEKPKSVVGSKASVKYTSESRSLDEMSLHASSSKEAEITIDETGLRIREGDQGSLN